MTRTSNDDADAETRYPVGSRVEKMFGSKRYRGEVTRYANNDEWYHVVYEDGDEEDLDQTEMDDVVVVEKPRKIRVGGGRRRSTSAKKRTPASGKKTKGRRRSLVVAHLDDDDEEDDEAFEKNESDDEPPAPKRPRVTRKQPRKASRVVKQEEDEDEEDEKEDEKEDANDEDFEEEAPARRSVGRRRSAVKVEPDVDMDVDVNTPRQRRQRKKINYADQIESGDDEDEDEEAVVKKEEEEEDDDDGENEGKPKKSTRKKTTTRKRAAPRSAKRSSKRPVVDDDSEASFVADDAASSSEEEPLAPSSDESVSFVATVTKKSKAASKKSKAASKNAKAEPKTTRVKMADAYQPLSAPLFPRSSLAEIAATKSFLDPCGMEATDDVIDRLVGEQLDKVAGLLRRALEDADPRVFPLRLGTACSGTDAPALATTLLSERMALRGDVGELPCEHVFSCENDPFKQAYLARNFDSELYPDIARLTDDPPTDVFGRPRPLPKCNLFVAGTSCKNFSMLRSRYRLDIEDKGCSGETFLAAVECLFKERPAFAIFENVVGAPWAKMSEYITGRVRLSDCDDGKAVRDVKDRNKDLVLVREKGHIVVDRVPSVYGVRCGTRVKGFTTPDQDELVPVTWPSGSGPDRTLAQVLKASGVNRATDTLVLDVPVNYRTRTAKVDTKDYGLPQTRQRTYMFVWRVDDDEKESDVDLGDCWEALVRRLRSPVRHSLESFVLQVDHDAVRTFREALRGPAGRRTRSARFREPDFWTSANANLRHNAVARERSGMEEMARTLTSWGPRGRKRMPPHYWLEYADLLDQRRVDLLEILHASALRDAECHDSNCSDFFWNVSQNASKEKHRSATPGIAGCVTPGGDVLLPRRGRPLLGCEKLLLQGIPYFRLALGNETEVQLGDLAGNAMSLTVVCACMVAAITCGRLKREVEESGGKSIEEVLRDDAALARDATDDDEADANLADPAASEPSADPLLRELAGAADGAVRTSVWCTCETSGRNTLSSRFLICRDCRISVCRDCCGTVSGYQTESHDMEEIEVAPEDRDAGNFMRELRRIVPPTLSFGTKGIAEIAAVDGDRRRVAGLAGREFRLHRVRRDRRRWTVVYYARENRGVGEAVAELRLTVGELGRRSATPALGARAELTSFAPARHPPLTYGALEPCAVATVLKDDIGDGPLVWQYRAADPPPGTLTVVGTGETPSARREAGLTEMAADTLRETIRKRQNVKLYAAAKKVGEERRWIYPDNWATWPEVVEISGGGSAVDGSYRRAACRQTTNQSALWVSSSDRYLILKPNVSRTGPDAAVISKSIDHDDVADILAVFPSDWQPCDALTPKSHKVRGVVLRDWKRAKDLTCHAPESTVRVKSSKKKCPNDDTLLTVEGLTPADVAMFLPDDPPRPSGQCSLVALPSDRGRHAQRTVRVFNALCVVPILRHAASPDFPHDLSPDAPWTTLKVRDGAPLFGTCEITVPPRPGQTWYRDEERGSWERQSEPGASRGYHAALRDAPRTFELRLDRAKGSLSVGVRPEVSAHHAAAQLAGGRGGDLVKEITVEYRLADARRQRDPILRPFSVSNCRDQEPTRVPLRTPHALYDRQERAVTRMLAIENRAADFEELEMDERPLPGSTGWSLVARATQPTRLRGGVIADCIGAGKTVVSIAVVSRGLAASRAARSAPRKSSATLVVVPPGLIDQWESEFKRFAPEDVRVVCVYDRAALETVSAKEILEADVVIAPIDILESKDYFLHVINAANKKKVGVAPKLPTYTGQQEKIGADGVWIPSSSADPYGGANNSNNQKRRNESAYYTYVYLDSIQKLRTMEFPETKKGVPLEFFEWERVFVDEIHESLCTTKDEMKMAKEVTANGDSGFFQERNRRAGRELLGITEKDVRKRPLVFRKSIFGLTGTPLLDSSQRVIELANLMGNTYVIGLSSHWRKLERESGRDIFLHNYLEPKQSREVRKNIYHKCQEYLKIAAFRNKAEEEMEGIELCEHVEKVRMTKEEKELYLESQSGIEACRRSFAIAPEDFDASAGHDISKFLRQNSRLISRGRALVDVCRRILKENATTKIVVFTDGRIGSGNTAKEFLCAEDDLGCTCLDQDDTVAEKNRKISWYQNADVTVEDKARPRVLVLHFEHAAGLNLQTECYNLVLFTPLYVGEGGSSSDPTSDTSTELQAIGRVFRPGQAQTKVNVYRLEVQGPEGEECLDGQLIRRNTDKETINLATNSSE